MRLRQWLANRPIHAKLSLINGLVVLAALLPIIGVTLGYEYYAVRQATLLEAQIQADIIRDSVAAAAAFGDADSASEILHALRSSPNATQAVLLLPNGQALARYSKPGISSPPPAKLSEADQAHADWSHVLVARNVRLEQDIVGWLAVETSMEPLYQRLRFYLLANLLSIAFGFAIAYPLSSRLKESITGPLSELMEQARHVTTHQDYNPKRPASDRHDEIGSLSRAFDKMLSGVRERDLKLSQMAYYDNVTGLTNRHYFMERLGQAVANTHRYGSRCCLMFIDLDNFKIVNDTLGHHVGDDLLREVAKHLTRVSRNNDVLCRIGGDEFAIILDNIKDLKGPGILAQKIIDNLSRPMILHGQQVVIGASIGISACPDHADNMADLLRMADVAMYQAKGRGKNCFQHYLVALPD